MTEFADDSGRYMDDDGNELNPDLVPKPGLCLSCARDDDPDEEEHILCNLTRLDQQDEPEFECFSYEPKTDNLSDRLRTD